MSVRKVGKQHGQVDSRASKVYAEQAEMELHQTGRRSIKVWGRSVLYHPSATQELTV